MADHRCAREMAVLVDSAMRKPQRHAAARGHDRDAGQARRLLRAADGGTARGVATGVG